MCRHVAYLGPPVRLRSVITDPPHGLYTQSWAPRLQQHGTVNADGFGVGWYASGDPVPARYRHAGPIWGDEGFADLARVIRSGVILAAVRSATGNTDHGAAAIAPFASGPWLFSHNGIVAGWPDTAAALAATLPPAALLSLEARVDSALLWALVRYRLEDGASPAAALAGTITALEAAGVTGRFNFLLTDGHVIAATAAGDTLWYRPSGPSGPGVVVASEPDDLPGWIEVGDGSALTATAREVTLTPLGASALQTADEDGRIAIR
jgi:glutamine amidotransferase